MSRHKSLGLTAGLFGPGGRPELTEKEPREFGELSGDEETTDEELSPQDQVINTVSAVEVVQRVGVPEGVPIHEWMMLIELAAQAFEESGGKYEITAETLARFDLSSVTSAATRHIVFHPDNSHNLELLTQALSVRGVLPVGSGLTGEQNLAIAVLCSPDGTTWDRKLRKLGISQLQYDLWMKTPAFRKAFNARSREILENARAAADNNLVRQAINGNSVEAIKYLDKRTGRDPDRRNEMGGAQVLEIIIDVLSKHLEGDKLREIAAELEVRTNPNLNQIT